MNILFISFRLNSEERDGVSLETDKWASVLHEMGHNVFYFSGDTKAPEFARGFTNKFAHFLSKASLETTREVLVADLLDTIKICKPDLIVAENIFCLPENIGLSMAVLKVLEETNIKCLAHCHDFWWERERFDDETKLTMRSIFSQLDAQIVCINTLQQETLKEMGHTVDVIPNVMDFENPPTESNGYIKWYYGAWDKIVALVPVRLVPRKNLKLTAELIHKIEQKENKKCIVIFTHKAMDEGKEYWDHVKQDFEPFEYHFVDITLEEAYNSSDVVFYTTEYEGFGNALLETVYYKKPLVVNPYEVYKKDIKPKGFRFMENFDGTIDNKRLNFNYEIAERHFSYRVLRKYFNGLL